MKASQLREFTEAGVVACVLLADQKGDYLEVGPKGVLAVPPGVEPTGFHLVVAIKARSRAIVAQKNVGQELGGYHREALSDLEGFAKGFKAVIVRDPIEVVRAGKSVWTCWHKDKPNRVDIWTVAKDGKVTLFQVGVVTHDNGKTWQLLGNYRWCGKLFMDGDRIVGKPDHKKWGGFDIRRTILDQHEFLALVQSASLKPWKGTDEDSNPRLPEVPARNQAVVQWYIGEFAGQSGQGPANLYGGGTAWIHGTDIEGVEPNEDGVISLQAGDIVSYSGAVENWGSKKGGPPKLLNVRLVKRSW